MARIAPCGVSVIIMASVAAVAAASGDLPVPMAVGDVHSVFFQLSDSRGPSAPHSHHDRIIGSVLSQDADATRYFIRCDPLAALAAAFPGILDDDDSGSNHDDGALVEGDDAQHHHRRHAHAHAQVHEHMQRRGENLGASHHEEKKRRCGIPGPGAHVTMRPGQGVWEYSIDDGEHYTRHEICSAVFPSPSGSTTPPLQDITVLECSWSEAGISATAHPATGSSTTSLSPSNTEAQQYGLFVPVTVTAVPVDPAAMVELKLRQATTGGGANCPPPSTSRPPSSTPTSASAGVPSNAANTVGGATVASTPNAAAAAIGARDATFLGGRTGGGGGLAVAAAMGLAVAVVLGVAVV